MNKIDKFRGLLEINLHDEPIILNSLNVNDLFDFLLLQKQEEQFTFGCKFFTRIICKSFPEEEPLLVEQFVIGSYVELVEELMIALGWTTRGSLNKLKEEKDTPKETKEQSIALFKARLAQEVNAEEVEDKYVTACYVLMREFKYTNKYILEMPATVFLILLDEMNKQAEREKEEMKKNKTLK